MLGTKVIPGASTVEFEKVVRDRVLESIDNPAPTLLNSCAHPTKQLRTNSGEFRTSLIFTRTTVSML